MKPGLNLSILTGFMCGLIIAMAYSCATAPAIQMIDGEVRVVQDERTWIKPFSNDGDEYARSLMKARGYNYEPPEDNFWLSLTLGIGIALGGVFLAGGIILSVFSKGIYLKEGLMAIASGLLLILSFYGLMEYMNWLLAILGLGVVIAIAAGAWYVIHNREAILRMVRTTESAKTMMPDATGEAAAKTTFREIQGPYQSKLKQYHDLAQSYKK